MHLDFFHRHWQRWMAVDLGDSRSTMRNSWLLVMLMMNFTHRCTDTLNLLSNIRPDVWSRHFMSRNHYLSLLLGKYKGRWERETVEEKCIKDVNDQSTRVLMECVDGYTVIVLCCMCVGCCTAAPENDSGQDDGRERPWREKVPRWRLRAWKRCMWRMTAISLLAINSKCKPLNFLCPWFEIDIFSCLLWLDPSAQLDLSLAILRCSITVYLSITVITLPAYQHVMNEVFQKVIKVNANDHIAVFPSTDFSMWPIFLIIWPPLLLFDHLFHYL